MPKYRVIQAYSGAIDREIEADSEEEALEKMVVVEDITLEEMMDSNWDHPEIQEILE